MKCLKYFFINININQNLFLLIIFLSNFYDSVNIIYTGKYPLSKRLNNGNYIVISASNITIVNSNFNGIISTPKIYNPVIYENYLEIGSTSVSQFIEGYQIIISIIKKSLIIFSKEGEILKEEESLDFIDPRYSYSIIPNENIGDIYYFTIIYASDNSGFSENNCNFLKFRKCSFDSSSNSITIQSEISFQINFNNGGFYSFFSCNTMKKNNNNYIACFYGNQQYIACSIFDYSNNYKNCSTNITNLGSGKGGQIFKAVVLPDERKKAICCFSNSGNPFSCLNYNIETNSFSDLKEVFVSENKCGYYASSLIMEYFKETNQFIIGCVGERVDFYLSQFSQELQFEKILNTRKVSGSDGLYRLNIILPTGANIYNILGYSSEPIQLELNAEIDIETIPSTILVCDNYYNYNRTLCLEIIPEGYYCNSSNDKTIDKCHQNCKTCNSSFTDNNNNCLTCPDSGTIYFYQGNCLSNCPNGFYEENSIKKCKCTTNFECSLCNSENKCLSCNDEKQYYAKKEINGDSIKNCYNTTTIGPGYFLNMTSKLFEQCDSNCAICDENKICSQCENGYSLITNKNNIQKCYLNCTYYFYFDESGYHCTDGDNCPPNFKLINGKGKCIDDCSNDNVFNYTYEYKNECFNQCPSNSYPLSDNIYKCEEYLNCTNYYNYTQTGCIDSIPDGYYCNSSSLKTIDKCYQNCKTCKTGGTESNNNCLTCPESGKMYFHLGNCYLESECTKETFIDSNNTKRCKCLNNITCELCNEEGLCLSCNNGYYPKSDDNNNIPYINCYQNPEGYYLNNNEIYEKCYNSCKSCNEKGDENNNKCTECKLGYEFKNDSINNNICYEICAAYYYDGFGNYQCLTEKTCPDGYNKFIKEKNRCIDECHNDNIYKYEYQGECYKNCPNGTKEINNNFSCETISQEYSSTEIVIQTELVIETESPTEYVSETESPTEYVIKTESPTEYAIKTESQTESITEIIIKKDVEECNLVEGELDLLIENELYLNDINSLTKQYIDQFGLSNNNVSKQENDFYAIYLYKNATCLQNKTNEAPLIDFGICYNKVKETLGIQDDLIIVIINNKQEKSANSLNKFYFSNPINGSLLNITEICSEEKIIIKEDVMTLIEKLDDKKEEYIIYLAEQGIDVFNISDKFYKDLCLDFESPNGRDVPLKVRLESFYPNISLCEDGCQNKGVDLETMKARCECIINDLMNNQIMDNLYGQAINEVLKVINSLNIRVFQCFEEIFKKERFKKCIGGYFVLTLLFGEIFCSIQFLFEGLYSIRKFIFSLTKSFYEYKQKNNNIFTPPKKKKSKSLRISVSNKANNNYLEGQENMSKKNKRSSKAKGLTNYPNINNRNSLVDSKFKLNDKKYFFKNKQSLNGKSNISEKLIHLNTDKNSEDSFKDMNNIKEFLSNSFDETDFDEVYDKEKRKYCEYFCEVLKKNQIFIYTFCNREIMRPRVLKILILIMTIELYFVINALFYNEDYLSDLFLSTKKERFFSFVPRRFNQFVYVSLVNGIISYLIGYFFVEEEKLKRIFLKNKDDEIRMKYELSELIKDIKQRFIGLIFSSIFLSIICFIYISCFNIAYPYIREEWIKSSIFILILMQIINLVITFFHCSLKYLSIKCNSEKMFKLSQWLAL